MPYFENVAQLLRSVRNDLGLGQEAFASALGVKLSRLQKWESGVNEPRFTISELRALRRLNRGIVDAMISGLMLLPRRMPEKSEFPRMEPPPAAHPRMAKQDKEKHS